MKYKQEEGVNELEEDGRLLESWPDDTEEGILASALRAMLPASEASVFSDGEFLAQREEPCLGVYKIEEGTVEMDFGEEAVADTDDDEVSPCRSAVK